MPRGGASTVPGPAVGRFLTRLGIGCLPEETAPPPALAALALPALTKAEARPA